MSQDLKNIQGAARDPRRNEAHVIPNMHPKLSELINKVYQRRHNSLDTIDLNNKRMGEEGGRYLAVVLPYYFHIQYLYLSNCGINASVCQALSLPFKEITGLLELNLSKNDMGPEGAMKISEGIVYMQKLLVLNLEHTKLGPRGVNVMTEALLAARNIQVLNLANNDIGPAGAACLAKVLSEITLLRHLDISVNSIGQQGAEVLSKGIHHLKELEKLSIGNNNIGTAGLLKIIEDLPVTMSELGLEMNNIDDYGLIKLLRTIQSFVNFKVLILDSNLITDKGAKELASLKTLNLSILSLVGCEVYQFRKELTYSNLNTEILF